MILKISKVTAFLVLSLMAINGAGLAEINDSDVVQNDDAIQANFEKTISEKPISDSVDSSELKKKKEVPIQPGDKIKIKIYPEDDYIKGGDMQVSSEGNITLPLLGKIDVSGKSVAQAEKEIAKMIDADYLVNPEVVIEMTIRSEAAKRTVIVFGQVRKPGPYDFPMDKKRMTLLEVISLAGGFTEVANIKKIKVVRKQAGKKTVINVNGEDVMNGEQPDIEVEHGDVITVSESLF